MTDTAYVTRQLSNVPLVLNPNLKEIGRHVADRNNLGVFDSPATLAVVTLAEEYICRHSDDFERERDDVALWSYRGETDADALAYDRLEHLALPDHVEIDPDTDDDGDDESGTNNDDDRRMRITVDW
jgi:hypothetical protein